jgi:predicted site-specific integrase-resolvase
MNNQPPKQNYRPQEAADYLGVAISTVWLYAQQDKLHPVKLSPRVTIFKKEDLDHLIANGITGAA